MAERLHIDTDGGVDDALALMLLIRGGAHIETVSAVFGNTHVVHAAANASMVLRQSLCPAEVLVGAAKSLAGYGPAHNARGHGIDGLNGRGGSLRRKLAPLQRAHGLNRIGLATQQKVKGVFLGPLTNLAQAVLDDPVRLRDWRPVVMAGAFQVEGRGGGGADFNTWCDPEALRRVLLYGVTPRLTPLDITGRVVIPRERVEAGLAADTLPLMTEMAGALRPYMDFQAATWGEGLRPHDAVVAATVLWPELFIFKPIALVVDDNARGRILEVDHAPNAWICTQVQEAEVARRLADLLFPV